MSVFGEGLIERLHEHSVLRNPAHPMHKIINNGIGGWLDNYDANYLGEQVFLESATGKWLDLHGKEYGVPRRLDEDDETYRNRIVYEALEHLTVNYLMDVYGLNLYTLIEDFDVEDNTLASDNPYLGSDGFMSIADSTVKNILEKKFVINGGVIWLTL